MEKQSLSHKLNGETIKETSSLASDMLSSPGLKSNNIDTSGIETIISDKTTMNDNNSFDYLFGDMNPTGNDLDFLENAENTKSNDFLNYGWEIGDFKDVDKMFRSCDSTFGLGGCKENELDWLSSVDDPGGSRDALKLDCKFQSPEPNVVEDISENHDFSKGYSINDSSMNSEPIGYKCCSWSSEESDSFMSFVSDPAIADSKDEVTPQELGLGFNHEVDPRILANSHSKIQNAATINGHKRKIKLPNQLERKIKEHFLENGSSIGVSDLSDEVMHLPSGITSHKAFVDFQGQQQQNHSLCADSYNYSYTHSDNTHVSDPVLVSPKTSTIKYESKELTPLSSRNSFHPSSQLQYVESSHEPSFEATALAVCEHEKLNSRQGTRSSLSSSLENGSMMSVPGLVGKDDNHIDRKEVSFGIPVEIGSSNAQQSSAMTSGLVDISLEAASFHQLQHVMEQLDLTTKLCIRDSLYRLARNAEQRNNQANLMSTGNGDERDAGGGASLAEDTNKCISFMDIETDTNPVDRSVAHLLFHRPSDSSTNTIHDSYPFKSTSVVRGPVAIPPVLEENFVSEETASEVDKMSIC